MSYQMTVTLTDQEYQTLVTEATKIGKDPEKLLHEMIQRLQSSEENYAMTGRQLAEKLYHEGKLATLATPYSLTPQEQAERERLARLFASSKPASEMVIEDRGPY